MTPWSMSSNSGCPILLPSTTTNRYSCARSSTSERAIDISKRIDAVRTGPSEHSPGPRSELLAAAADQLEPNRRSRPRHDQQCCQQLRRNQLAHIHCRVYRVGVPGDRRALYTGLLIGADLRSRSIKWLTNP